MVDILVRGVGEETAKWLRAEAEREGRSVNDLTKEALDEKACRVKTRRDEFWQRVDQLRGVIGPLGGDAAADIREFRENR